MRITLFGLLLIMAASLTSGPVSAQSYSELWGKDGELWSPESRLPDFSFAGYRFGEKPLPTVNVVANVKDFGAKGDDSVDDTEAFKKAITSAKNGAVFIPEGRYIISDILWIKTSNIVLRGAGPDKTILHITNELEDVKPNMGSTTGGRATSNYSWSGGFIWAKGRDKPEQLGSITSTAKRGGSVIKLDKAVDIKVGQRVKVEMKDTSEKTLLTHLYAGDPGDLSKIIKPITIGMVSRVKAVDGKTVTLERPLRWDIRQEWSPVLKRFEPSVSEVGVEDLAISFPKKPYKGHFTERGMNGIAMNGIADCWIKNVKISNCDSGVFIGGTNCTVEGLVIDGTRPQAKGDTGHHGVTLGQDCLMDRFEITTKFIHDITVSNRQAGNVFKNGKGTNLSFDHHKRVPYENLFCNIDVGDGGQVWRCGGGRALGKHCGARGTFWGITSKKMIKWPRKQFSPDMINVVGVKTESDSVKVPNGKWFETMPPTDLEPKDLHAAQLERRLKNR